MASVPRMADRQAIGAYEIQLSFESDRDMKVDLWAFEQGRAWASPYSWRIDDGRWTDVGTDAPMQQLTHLSDGPNFAWSPAGAATVNKGDHVLEVRVSKPKENGHYLLSQDCFMFVPRAADPEVLLRSGDKGALIVRLPTGDAELILCQVMMAGRLKRDSANYDPAMERLFLNLLAFE